MYYVCFYFSQQYCISAYLGWEKVFNIFENKCSSLILYVLNKVISIIRVI